MEQGSDESNEVKMYSDFKSPYAYIAFDPGMALPERFKVRVRWIPFQLRLKAKGERHTSAASSRRLMTTSSACRSLFFVVNPFGVTIASRCWSSASWKSASLWKRKLRLPDSPCRHLSRTLHDRPLFLDDAKR